MYKLHAIMDEFSQQCMLIVPELLDLIRDLQVNIFGTSTDTMDRVKMAGPVHPVMLGGTFTLLAMYKQEMGHQHSEALMAQEALYEELGMRIQDWCTLQKDNRLPWAWGVEVGGCLGIAYKMKEGWVMLSVGYSSRVNIQLPFSYWTIPVPNIHEPFASTLISAYKSMGYLIEDSPDFDLYPRPQVSQVIA